MKTIPPMKSVVFTILPALVLTSSVFAMERLGTAAIDGASGVSVFNTADAAKPVMTWRIAGLTTAGPHIAIDDFMFAADGTSVRAYARGEAGAQERAVWSLDRPVLSLAAGPERGMVLVLDDRSVNMVRFQDGSEPVQLWSYPIAQTGAPAGSGRLLLRDGRQIYVADSSVPGVRVLTLEPSGEPVSAATWHSADGPVRDMALWNRTLTVVTPRGLSLLDASGDAEQALRQIGVYKTAPAPAAVDLNSHWAFLGSGSDVVVLDIDPSSPGFLQEPVDSIQTAGAVRALRLDKRNRLYVLEPGGYEILGVAPFGGR